MDAKDLPVGPKCLALGSERDPGGRNKDRRHLISASNLHTCTHKKAHDHTPPLSHLHTGRNKSEIGIRRPPATRRLKPQEES